MGSRLRTIKSWSVSAVVGYFAACAPVQFSRQPDPSCGTNGVTCVSVCTGKDNCVETRTIERRVGDALVDILFVNDNSGSMSNEQNKMALKFPDFINQLDGKGLNYRIGMVTTDISFAMDPSPVQNHPKPANGNGAWQDGKLIDFGSGIPYLTPTTPDRGNLFARTVKRNETLNCESSGFDSNSCPSMDERGIYAANLVLEQTGSSFLRPTAHLAVIILADEDERSLSDPRGAVDPNTGITNANDLNMMKSYPQKVRDLPQTFTDNMARLYPDKTFSVHSVIIRPKEFASDATELNDAKSCYSQQNSQAAWVRGYPGYAYAALSQMTGGTINSICDPDYSGLLNKIGSTIQNQVTSLPFSCTPIVRADGTRFSFYINDTLRNDLATPDYEHGKLNINVALAPMTKVKLVFDCRL